MLSSFRQNLLGCVRNSTRARKTCRETSTGTPRDTCTRGAVDHQILDVSYNIYKSKHLGRGAFFVLFSPFRELLLPSAVILLTQWSCVAVIFAFKASCGFTLTSAGSRNIILATAKISLWRSQNITCEANITAHRNPRAANPEFPFHGFWKEWFSKTRAMVDFYIVYKKYISLANIFLILYYNF